VDPKQKVLVDLALVFAWINCFIIASKVVAKGNKMLAITYEALKLIKTMVVFFQGVLKQS
jgi:hypothetical protein